jgi:hypothetical protein
VDHHAEIVRKAHELFDLQHADISLGVIRGIALAAAMRFVAPVST